MAIAELWELLQQDPEHFHQFFRGASARQLEAAEAELGARFSISFARWLSLTGGARLFERESILGVGPETPESLALIDALAELRRGTPPLPQGLIPFSPYDDGVYCFDTRLNPEKAEYEIVFWRWDGTIEPASHRSFDEWLFELTEFCRAESVGDD